MSLLENILGGTTISILSFVIGSAITKKSKVDEKQCNERMDSNTKIADGNLELIHERVSNLNKKADKIFPAEEY